MNIIGSRNEWRLRSHLVSEIGDLFGQFRILLDKRFIDFNKFSNLFSSFAMRRV
jgi:hypothetical protein